MDRKISDEITGVLADGGLRDKGVVMVHAGMTATVAEIRRKGLTGRDVRFRSCKIFEQGLWKVIGKSGTLCVPGFFYDYAKRGYPFDARTSPPDHTLGAFPRFFFEHSMTHRSLCPTVSIMARGSAAKTICGGDSINGNGLLSPWAEMVKKKAWMLFWEATPESMTFVHHVETLAGVPHLYNKIFRVPIIEMSGKERPFCVNAVRFLDTRFPINYNLTKMWKDLVAEGLMVERTWGTVRNYLVSMVETHEFLLQRLQRDPYYLLESEPSFVRGILPDDGPS